MNIFYFLTQSNDYELAKIENGHLPTSTPRKLREADVDTTLMGDDTIVEIGGEKVEKTGSMQCFDVSEIFFYIATCIS